MEISDNVCASRDASLRGKVFERLENDILDGRYQPGEDFTECRVASELGVSRTPVREAIRQLELEGLVDYVPNKGATVKGISEEDIRDIGEIRTHLEAIAARRAATNLDASDLRELQEVLDLEMFHTGRGETVALEKMDTRFHEIIYRASGSRLLERTLRSFHHYIRRARHLSLDRIPRAEKTLCEHRAIGEALEQRNGQRAAQLMAQHVRNASRNIIRRMEEASHSVNEKTSMISENRRTTDDSESSTGGTR